MKQNPPKKSLNNWAKFSQIGIQMGITIALCAYGGAWLDKKFPHLHPWGTAGLSLFGVFAALFNVFKETKAMEENNNE